MSSGTLADGTVFAGRYRVVRCIASGGMGAVYEVVHLETERRRALKVMHPQLLHNDDLRSRFRREARVAAKVESKHIVDVSDAGIDEATGMPFLVMELLHGEELGKRLVRVHRFAPAEVLLYLHQTALALDKTHRAQIVHRDLKPDNLFLCEHEDGPPSIKVLDFGIAKLVAEGSAEAQATRSLGTPMYMAPEQFRSAAAISPATDIFALGMIAYTLLVGAGYWIEESRASGNVYEFVGAAAGGPREPPTARALRRGITLPPAFDAWFARTTAPSPADRFPSASAAVQALAYALGLPQPGQEPHAPVTTGAPAASSSPAAAWTGPFGASTGPGGLPPGAVAVSSGAGPSIPALGTPPAVPRALSSGSGTEIISSTVIPVHGSCVGSSHTLRGTEIITGPVVPVRPAHAITAGEPTALPAASRRRSAAMAAVAISAVLLLVGGAALYYTLRTVLLPRFEAAAPAESGPVPAAIATPEAPGSQTTPATVEPPAAAVSSNAPSLPAPASGPAPVQPKPSTASSSASPVPAAAARPTASLPARPGRSTGTAKTSTRGIHVRD